MDTEQPCGFQVDVKFELRRLQDGKVGRLGTLENGTGVDADLTKHVGGVGSVTEQQPGCRHLAQKGAGTLTPKVTVGHGYDDERFAQSLKRRVTPQSSSVRAQRCENAGGAEYLCVVADRDRRRRAPSLRYGPIAGITRLPLPSFSGNISGNTERGMAGKAKSSVAKHRARMERQGLMRVEVNVRREDASLVRRIASALSDPARQAEARMLLRQRFAEPPKMSLKALLAAAPLDGIDLDRTRDSGRDVDL